MNIRLGVYEIFSRIVPGLFYIAAIVQFLVILGLLEIDWKIINEISLTTSIGIILVAYFVGEALDRFALYWFRLFKKRGFSARSFSEFKRWNQDRWFIDFRDHDWPMLLAYIRTKNLELASEIERNNALSIMLRNISFGLLLTAISNQVQFFISWDYLYTVIGILLFIVSVLLARESVKFRRWFYFGIYETIIAFRIELDKYVKPLEAKKAEAENENE